MKRASPSPARALSGRRKTAGSAVVILFWVAALGLVGARVALFDEIRPRPPGATVSFGAGGQG